MLPPPRRSTLFPYTTLFRSHGQAAADDLAQAREVGPHAVQLLGTAVGDAEARDHLVEDQELYGVRPDLTDRKSTRLNSSHANISYAVFCLKKKKHQAIRGRS